MTAPTSSQPGSGDLSGPPRSLWRERFASVLFAILCLEVGFFLVIYPWTDSWSLNWLITLRPELTPFLLSDQFRGAITGLGVLNLFIGVYEALRLRRFSSH